MSKTVRILLLGDLVGNPGCAMLEKHCTRLKQQYAIDVVMVNGENSAPQGRGINIRVMELFKRCGVDMVTSGNHIWNQRDIYQYLDQHNDLLRPENFPSTCPGKGVTTINVNGHTIGFLNLQGRVFMRELVDCPFRAAESALAYLRAKARVIIVDMHAEATAEKLAIAYHLDGRVSAVVGTHTHVQTADERILPKGTAYITDLGMSGSINSMIGMKAEPIIQSMMTQMPVKMSVETEGPFIMTGVWLEVDIATGKALAIERIRIVDNDLRVQNNNE
jgi:metallophosphoesterase (TIGR00282 family)